MLQVRELSIPGALEITPQVHGDDRGVFLEWFRGDRFAEATGHRFDLQQANCSVSAAGTLRGIHFAQLPPSQAKYVTCLSGTVVDVVVDLREGSPAFGTWETVTLDSEARRAVYLSEGLGHGFMALTEDAVVAYLCSATYAPDREHGIHPFDPELGIEWPATGLDGRALEPMLSPKDDKAPSLAEVRAAGLLASYDDARAFAQSLPRD